MVEWAGDKYDIRYPCKHCGAEFDAPEKLRGHMVGAHSDRTYPTGRKHPGWKRIQHGTIAGYQQELRRGKTPCRKCKKARAEYVRKRYHMAKEG